MRTLLLGDRPFAGLRSRAVVLALGARHRAAGPILVRSDAPRLPPGFEPVPTAADPARLGVGRVLIAGIFRNVRALEAVLAIAAPLVADGATLEVAGFTAERDAARPAPPRGVEVLDAAALIEPREHHTADALLLWRVAAPFRIEAYPERFGEEDATLAQALPPGPVLGLAMPGGPEPPRLPEAGLDVLRARLARHHGWPVLPLPVDPADGPADDLPAILDAAAALLPDSPVLLPELRDPDWRRRNLTLGRLRGLVARCATVVGGQDLPAAHAIGRGIPVIGIAMGLGPERRIVSCLAALANDLPAGSELIWLGVPRFPQRSPAVSAASL